MYSGFVSRFLMSTWRIATAAFRRRLDEPRAYGRHTLPHGSVSILGPASFGPLRAVAHSEKAWCCEPVFATCSSGSSELDRASSCI